MAVSRIICYTKMHYVNFIQPSFRVTIFSSIYFTNGRWNITIIALLNQKQISECKEISIIDFDRRVFFPLTFSIVFYAGKNIFKKSKLPL